MVGKKPNQIDPKFRALCPDLSEKDLATAKENLDLYFESTLAVFKRITNDPVE
jgi:hypothetical protein